MTIKYDAHIKTGDFSYIGFSLEGSAEDAVAAYREIADLVKVQPKGLSEAEFRGLYDLVARGQPIQADPGIMDDLNPCQRYALNQAKLFVKRNK